MGKISDSSSNNCSVPECKSRGTNEVTLFPFPKEETQRKKWTDAMKIESKISLDMQVCSRHFVKNDYIISENAGAKIRRLKRTAVPSQNLPWQFPNKRVSPTLAKARMERLKNRSLQKVSDSPSSQSETPAKTPESGKKPESAKKQESAPLEKNKDSEKSEETEPVKDEVKSEDDESTENASVDPDADDDVEEVTVEENGGEASEAKKDENAGHAPTRLRHREGVLKCEYCGRKCLTPKALQTHQHNAHKNARNSLNNKQKDSSLIDKTKSSPKPSTVGLISVKSPENLLAKPPLNARPILSLNSRQVEKVLQDDSDYVPTSSDSDTSVKDVVIKKRGQRKTEFQCPKCMRRFAVYFQAFKHMQKHHCGTPNGSNSANIVQTPTRIEICTICNTVIYGDVHLCPGPLKFAMGFVCSGCEQEFKTLAMFDMHKSSMHSEGVESMFFSTLDDFGAWKKKMEAQTKVNYTTLDQNDTKKIYRCSHRTVLGPAQHSPQRMCPSSVVVQEFTKGFQVHYYPNHYDHDYQKYNLSGAFKKYSITSLMNLTANQLPDSDDEPLQSPDLYLQFKKINETLVNEAARINVNGLKKLMRKALEMMDIVNSYVEDDDDEMIGSNSVLKLDSSKDDLQDEVRTALLKLKRRSIRVDDTSPVTPVKKKKAVFQSTENTLKTPPPSIAYKGTELKRKELIKMDSPTNMKGTELKRKEPIKMDSPTNTKGTEVKRKEPVKINSPTFVETFQNFVGSLNKPNEKRTEKKRQTESRKTPIVRTKIGQFKPKTPPKKVSFTPSPKTPVSPKKSNVKEVEYEVKEQENDCNILILKI